MDTDPQQRRCMPSFASDMRTLNDRFPESQGIAVVECGGLRMSAFVWRTDRIVW